MSQKKFSTRWAPFVHFVVIDYRLDPIDLGRNGGRRSAFVQFGVEPVAVERLVADQSFEIDAGDQGIDGDAVMALAWQKHEVNEIAECIDEHHDLGSQAATRAVDGLILSPPWFIWTRPSGWLLPQWSRRLDRILAAASPEGGTSSGRLIGDPPEDAVADAVRRDKSAFVEAVQRVSDFPLDVGEAGGDRLAQARFRSSPP